ncbi:peroxiredoxin family protein [Algoriphagus boritolerans]|uniref:Thiol-disulfide isomerase or thioredoxin n=1 Tax=Algoriphagus boritolerans DSM 17298 = JCM 18970 TaxID=1120964 RepID=A0A1H5TZ54_9BACT|nr:TlpA disulfide reductase family protein [Algoriphagus boritolerans]SEF68049.1 Thiol-disulfide isomerase or thioredoxin [Algoriphagus boritolerans DSM 17298 = JCM 18970]
MKKLIFLFGLPVFTSLNSFGQNTGFEAQGPPDNSIFPEFSYVTIDGDSVSSTDLKDKIVIVNIWFVGCTGCKQEEPYLRKVTEHYQGDDDIVFLGFCMTKPDRIKRYLEKNGEIGFSNISLTREEVEEKFKVRLSPSHFLIKNGILIAKYTGPITPAGNTLQWYEEMIRNLKN